MHKNLLKVLLLGTVLVSGVSLAYESQFVQSQTGFDTLFSGSTSSLPRVRDGFDGYQRYDNVKLPNGQTLNGSYIAEGRNGVTTLHRGTEVHTIFNDGSVSSTDSSGAKYIYNASSKETVTTSPATVQQNAAPAAPAAAPDPSITGNYDSLYGDGYTDYMKGMETQWGGANSNSTVTVQQNAPTVVATETTEYGVTVNKMSDGTYRYSDGTPAHSNDVQQAGFGDSPSATGGGTGVEAFDANGNPIWSPDGGKTWYSADGSEHTGDVISPDKLSPSSGPVDVSHIDINNPRVQELIKSGMSPQDAIEQAKLEALEAAEGKPDLQNQGKGSGGGDKKGGFTISQISVVNAPQYVIMIMEALEGNKTKDATKEVTVKGADPMGSSQGSPSSGATFTMPSTPMAGTTIADSAMALNTLLDFAKIDLGLLSEDMPKEETVDVEIKAPVTITPGTSGGEKTESANVPRTRTVVSESLTTDEKAEIIHRRALLLAEWAAAAAQIGEGSNAISSTFYDRAAAFAAAANAASGSLGGISAITDTDRFVLFELTRGTALSAIQLGLQGAKNLNNLDEVEIADTPSAGALLLPSITPGQSQ